MAWGLLLGAIAINVAWQLLRPILLPLIGLVIASATIGWWLDRRWRW